MLFLTPEESLKLRFKILRDLQTDTYVEIDTRFIQPLFGGTANLRRWCESWGLHHEFFTRPDELRSNKTPLEWVSFSYPSPEIIFII